MSLVKSIMTMELAGVFSKPNPDPMKPGKDIAKAFANYLKMGMNAGGFPTSNVVDTPAGMTIGGVFAQQLPLGTAIGSQIATALTSMALTYISINQVGLPVVSPSHTPKLIQLFSSPQPQGIAFAQELSTILDTWAKTWVVAGLIPSAPPIPFTGPLS
jgi:hypothetical protein